MFERQIFVRWAIGLLMSLAVLASAGPAFAYIPEGPDSGARAAFAQEVQSESAESFALGEEMAGWKLERLEDLSIP
jgi:hypothetical protein